MIRPDTPPGTEVICVDATAGPYGNGGLSAGALYTVERIAPAISGGYAVVLAEISPGHAYSPPWGIVGIGFELKRFRYLDIPKSLSALLNAATREAQSA